MNKGIFEMEMKDLGFDERFENHRIEHKLDVFEVGRVISEHKERYVVKTPDKVYDSELIGNLRFNAESRYDYPAVGDWVAFSEYDEGKGLIHAIYPRASIIERKAVGKLGQVQIIATNIDYGLIVQSVDRDFNLNRLERYLTICLASKVKPIIVLSKIDLIAEDELRNILNQIQGRIKDIPIFTVSNQTIGYLAFEKALIPGATYCLLGSSGVGKSTLLNHLSGSEKMKTGNISTSVKKGRHITSHRELFVLENGSIIIDNPGMREVGITDASEGLELTFDIIQEYAQKCRFKDCTHLHEKDCAVLQAIEDGEIDEAAYFNYTKMQKEQTHFEADAYERRTKDKRFGKMIKQVLKQKKQHKF